MCSRQMCDMSVYFDNSIGKQMHFLHFSLVLCEIGHKKNVVESTVPHRLVEEEYVLELAKNKLLVQ